VLRLVVRRYPMASVKDVFPPLIGFFYFQRVLLGDDYTNLSALENAVVRRRFDDPRIHFALATDLETIWRFTFEQRQAFARMGRELPPAAQQLLIADVTQADDDEVLFPQGESFDADTGEPVTTIPDRTDPRDPTTTATLNRAAEVFSQSPETAQTTTEPLTRQPVELSYIARFEAAASVAEVMMITTELNATGVKELKGTRDEKAAAFARITAAQKAAKARIEGVTS
jgi:hypothetical protein